MADTVKAKAIVVRIAPVIPETSYGPCFCVDCVTIVSVAAVNGHWDSPLHIIVYQPNHKKVL